MANLQLNQYISDSWYEAYRKNIDAYILHFGQQVRLLQSNGKTYNQYSDLIQSVDTATTVYAIISKQPFENLFLGPPLNYDDVPETLGFFAYFSRACLVRADDIVIIEGKSVEQDVVLEPFSVISIKGKRLEQEFIRRYFLAPITDSNPIFESNSILTTGTIVQDYSAENDVNDDPGGYSKDYYNTSEILPPPGTVGFIDPEKKLVVDDGPYEAQATDTYSTDYPANWIEGQPYDIGKPLKKE